jgi:hypothetical protein
LLEGKAITKVPEDGQQEVEAEEALGDVVEMQECIPIEVPFGIDDRTVLLEEQRRWQSLR